MPVPRASDWSGFGPGLGWFCPDDCASATAAAHRPTKSAMTVVVRCIKTPVLNERWVVNEYVNELRNGRTNHTPRGRIVSRCPPRRIEAIGLFVGRAPPSVAVGTNVRVRAGRDNGLVPREAGCWLQSRCYSRRNPGNAIEATRGVNGTRRHPRGGARVASFGRIDGGRPALDVVVAEVPPVHGAPRVGEPALVHVHEVLLPRKVRPAAHGLVRRRLVSHLLHQLIGYPLGHARAMRRVDVAEEDYVPEQHALVSRE